MQKVILFPLLTIGSLASLPALAENWPKHLCPADEAACLTINENNKPSPPKDLEKGRIVFAFGTDGCLASSPVWYDTERNSLKPNHGISTGGAKNGHCGYANQLNKAYIIYNEIESTNNPAYKARVFGLYAVKDDGYLGGHRHEWEHAIVWMKNGVPEFVSTTEHKGVNTRKASDTGHLPDNSNAFGVKYIIKKTTHYLDFAGKDKNNVVTNKDPSPDKTWFAAKDQQVVDFNQANPEFKSIINNRGNWGETVPRVNDRNFLNQQKPKEWKNISF
ncbi:NPP1 family protein [Acinetobacter sp. BSP-28]|uniref:NPP1 family protein n=1 Tax=Acinetobacter sp. BSP-28 TaxID=3344661 RepID=UPI00376FD67E